jgi:hypothetical protein
MPISLRRREVIVEGILQGEALEKTGKGGKNKISVSGLSFSLLDNWQVSLNAFLLRKGEGK